VITSDLRDITQRINKNNNLLSLFSDTVVTDKLRTAIHSISDASINANAITHNVNLMIAKVQAGEGVLGTLINDSSSEKKVIALLENLSVMSDTLKAAVNNLNEFSDNLNSKQGVIYSLSKDSTLNTDLKETVAELNKSSVILNENLKAMQKNFLFRKYFRQKEKAQKDSIAR
jgi:phospholipid/cholesterol/gamma-HCH transport system substrate-binding protein